LHSWGLAHYTIGLILGTTYVLRRKFEPEACLAEVARRRCDSLVVVPVMLQRILELPQEARAKYDASSLTVVAARGSALPGDLAIEWVEVPQGKTGRIFVGNEMLFEGYTGGGSKDVIGTLMATGDVGRFDEAGRLFVEGRDDEMIVSGGENVFPREVEDLLARHKAVADMAAIGVEDKHFGQRLRAFVCSSRARRRPRTS
jgi:acyl-CoA synthetase (AMP-forming)/AMP-acid ligase II